MKTFSFLYAICSNSGSAAQAFGREESFPGEFIHRGLKAAVCKPKGSPTYAGSSFTMWAVALASSLLLALPVLAHRADLVCQPLVGKSRHQADFVPRAVYARSQRREVF